MQRRDFLKLGGASLIDMRISGVSSASELPADVTLTIAPVTVELSPTLVFSTVGYNGTAPGPVLHMREGQSQIVDVVNETDVPEHVHWHGLFLPPELDGADEEGAVPVAPHSRRRFQFVPTPAGTRWYHTHTMAMADLHRGSYTGQCGFLIVHGARDT
ncbi:MAG TPA: multicopper oxidase domain-containing protein, partial [Vicinamibacterales bacterium]|nr:multicopper oxidase domain-containing protein [Vicinamibacterales bacterium]